MMFVFSLGFLDLQTLAAQEGVASGKEIREEIQELRGLIRKQQEEIDTLRKELGRFQPDPDRPAALKVPSGVSHEAQMDYRRALELSPVDGFHRGSSFSLRLGERSSPSTRAKERRLQEFST